MDLRHVSSRELAGQKLKGYEKRDITYENLVRLRCPLCWEILISSKTHDDVRKMSDIDVWVMALPNGVAKPWIDAIEEGNSKSLIVDLSADYRFHPDWTYGLPELIERSKIAKAHRISNPGCYAVSQSAKRPLGRTFMLIQYHLDSCADRNRSSAPTY